MTITMIADQHAEAMGQGSEAAAGRLVAQCGILMRAKLESRETAGQEATS